MRYFIFLLIYLFCSCDQGKTSKIVESSNILYLNHHESVNYVGKETCKECHLDIYNSFIQTGMGQSFDIATKSKSVIDENNNPLIYDKFKDLYYQPIWKKDSLFILEFRLKNKDTTHQFLQKIDYIIGSGQHTNSHLYSINGYLHQAPYTFYTQKMEADLPPGFEKNKNTRFNREIGLECISCHNAHVNHEENTINKYTNIPNGIDCERCHGPGEIHVKQKKEGIIIDTSKYIDYSIVNPSKLTHELQFDVCRRCHLQGISILQKSKQWDDFKPGKPLSETMEIYLPKYKNQDQFIMASHVDRLQQSNCYKEGGVTCISCHDPHKSVTTLPSNYFNQKCIECHNSCDKEIEYINCVSCHMPSSSSLDIPHVSITDHKISVHQKEKIEQGDFIGLICINNDNPSNINKAKAYLKYYESFQANTIYLDSAKILLDKCDTKESFPLYIQYFYLTKNYKKLLQYFETNNLDKYHKIMINSDLCNMYFRIADAYQEYDFTDQSYSYYLKTINTCPNNLNFQLKTAVLEIKMSKFELAKNRLKNIIRSNPNFKEAYYNLGSIYMNVDKNYKEALDCFTISLQLDPDYEKSKKNIEYLNKMMINEYQ